MTQRLMQNTAEPLTRLCVETWTVSFPKVNFVSGCPSHGSPSDSIEAQAVLPFGQRGAVMLSAFEARSGVVRARCRRYRVYVPCASRASCISFASVCQYCACIKGIKGIKRMKRINRSGSQRSHQASTFDSSSLTEFACSAPAGRCRGDTMAPRGTVSNSSSSLASLPRSCDTCAASMCGRCCKSSAASAAGSKHCTCQNVTRAPRNSAHEDPRVKTLSSSHSRLKHSQGSEILERKHTIQRICSRRSN